MPQFLTSSIQEGLFHLPFSRMAIEKITEKAMTSSMASQQTTSSSGIIQEIKSIVFQAAAIEKSGKWQEALDLYEDARFLALDSGLTECDLRIDPKSANVEAELSSFRRTMIAEMLKTAVILEKNQDIAGSLDIYNKALKLANDIDAKDILPGLLVEKARLEKALMPLKVSTTVAGLRAIGSMLVLFTMMIIFVFAWEMFGISPLFFNEIATIASIVGLFVIVIIPVRHVKWNVRIAIGIAALYFASFVISLGVAVPFAIIHALSSLPFDSIYSNSMYSIALGVVIFDGIIDFILGYAIVYNLAAQRASEKIRNISP